MPVQMRGINDCCHYFVGIVVQAAVWSFLAQVISSLKLHLVALTNLRLNIERTRPLFLSQLFF